MRFDPNLQRTVDDREDRQRLDDRIALDRMIFGSETSLTPAHSAALRVQSTQGQQKKTQATRHRSWLAKAIKTAGLPITAPVHLMSQGSKALAHEVGKVPVVGPLFSGIVDVTIGGPWHMTDDVFHGVRIDKAVARELKRQLKDFKEIGPYAQMVFSFIPGFGTITAAAIGAGLALANGQPISSALLAGVIGAVPGGPLAQAAVRVGAKTLQVATMPGGFKRIANVADIGISALPIPEEAKSAITGGVKVLANLASGKRIDSALIDGVVGSLPLASMPAEARQAIAKAADTIKDVAKGQRIDKALLQEGLQAIPISGLQIPDAAKKALSTLVDAGSRIAKGQHVESSIVQSALKNVPVGALPPTMQRAIGHVATVAKGLTAQANAAATLADTVIGHVANQSPELKTMVDALKSGAALGHAKALQTLASNQIHGPSTTMHGPGAPSPALTHLHAVGQSTVASDRLVRGAMRTVPSPSRQGFRVGVGLMRHRTGIFPMENVRLALGPSNQLGFDMALALHTGRFLTGFDPIPADAPPDLVSTQAGYLMTAGMQGAGESQKVGMMTAIASNSAARKGAVQAARDIAADRQDEQLPWYSRLWYGIKEGLETLWDWI